VRIYTIGHSNVPTEKIINLLRDHSIEILVDVRSQPYSRYSPQFNREDFQRILSQECIEYAFAGEWLGGRPKDPSCYEDGRVSYERMETKDWYRRGIARLLEIAAEKRTAIMCAEEDPRHCHRHNLVAKTLMEEAVEVLHIRGDGRLEDAWEVGGMNCRATQSGLMSW